MTSNLMSTRRIDIPDAHPERPFRSTLLPRRPPCHGQCMFFAATIIAAALAAQAAPAEASRKTQVPSEKKPPKERLVPLLPGDKTETHAFITDGQRLTLSLWGERRYVTCTSCDTKAPNFKKKTNDPRALELIMSKDLTTVSFDVIDAAALRAKPTVVSITLKDGRTIILDITLAPTKDAADERLVFVPF